jgi:hypothetical protein
MVELGNTSVTVIRGEVNLSTYSDKRIKNKIQDNVPGLSFVNLLKPVTYNLDIHKQNQMLLIQSKWCWQNNHALISKLFDSMINK